MKVKNILIVALAILGLNTVDAQVKKGDPYFGESCTSIMVGRKASVDGSVMTSHTCDGRYRTWLTMEKAADHADTVMHEVHKGTLRTETPWDTRELNKVGEIPQVAHTFAYLNTAYPCMNEKQLAIGETTFVGPDTLVNENGMFLIEELERIALQRCDNARDAIKLIGDLIKEHGYGDWGECITIADTREVWQMEILGEGPDQIGGVWAAQRIPDDHVGISANISRIGEIDRENEDFFMASDNIEEVAKKYDLWDGEGTFKFWKAYAARDKNFMIREFFVLNSLAPSLNLSMDMDEMPFSVKPEEKVSVEDVMAFYRETYEGTEWDMCQNIKTVKKKYDDDRNVIGTDTIISPVAHPWFGRDDRNAYNFQTEKAVQYQRTVAVAWCSYSHVIQLRDWLPDEIGGVAWFSFDNPAESPRVPIYAGVLDLPENYNFCGQKRYREDAAIWNYRKANKLATVSWGRTKDLMLENVLDFQEKAMIEMPAVEKRAEAMIKDGKVKEAKEFITRYTNDFAGSTTKRWNELEAKFWRMFGLGF